LQTKTKKRKAADHPDSSIGYDAFMRSTEKKKKGRALQKYIVVIYLKYIQTGQQLEFPSTGYLGGRLEPR